MRDYPEQESARNQPQWPRVAAIGGVAALAIVAGFLLFLNLNRANDAGAGQGSASSQPSGSQEASQSAEASASVEPTLVPVAILPNRAIAEVTSGMADVHRQPDDASPLKFTLDTGGRMFVIGEPQVTGDQRWYRIALVAEETCEPACEGIGWVATSLTGESSVEEVDVDCPASPIQDKELGALERLEKLHCYGRTDIVVTGIVDTPCCGYVGPYFFKPAWLALPFAPAFLQAGRGAITFRHDPSIDLDVPQRGDIVRVIGHFEDPAATHCRVTIDPAVTDPVDPVDDALVILKCRATFVWTAYRITGHKDLGPCCGSVGTDRPVARQPIPAMAGSREIADRVAE
jgi:hypothetical protein